MSLLRKKGVRITLCIFLAVVIIWHIVWFVNYQTYKSFSGGYEKYRKQTMGKAIGEYSYTIKAPSYPQFTGNYVVCTDNLSIFIWPGLFNRGAYEIGAEVIDSAKNERYEIYINERIELDYSKHKSNSDEENEILSERIKKNKIGLEELFKLAKTEWEL